jgi:hypothetical protein
MEPNAVIAPGLEVQSENDWDNTDGLFVNGGTPPGSSHRSKKLPFGWFVE